ncbi:MAG: ATP-binding cassette domain-containing protein [Chloroflexi bacterium]|nr:ATP-binding cassette domain-containing protein [Chloroflexota bacterium]
MIAQVMDNDNDVIIDLRHLSKVYGSGPVAVRAVDDVSLHVARGEIVAVMGPSGSGKTTLLQIIGALMRPTSGEVMIGGRDIASLPEKALPQVRLKTFGFIFQTPNLLSTLTAAQNVEMVVNLGGVQGNTARNKAAELLERLGLGHRLSHRPAMLSGGEQQRVAVARALANDPQVLLADEPTANLDSKSGQTVTELLRNISKEQGKTIVIVSHDHRIRALVDRTLWLEDGRLRVRWSDGVTLDPVCLMAIERTKTPDSFQYDGDTYYFCSVECKKRFEASPAKYRELSSSL